MPGQGGRRNGRVDEEDSRPLLVSSREDLSLRSTSTENILFAIEGDEDEPETSALEDTDTHRRSKADQTVRFQEHVQVIALPLRSTLESREAAYELDSDDLDDDAVAQTNLEQRGREQSMPLLVGLLDASAVRRSLDIPMGVDCAPEYSDVDLEELVAKQKAGGGMLNSIANMANSILGAGLPYAMSRAGFFTGILLLVVLSAVTDWTIRLIVTNAKLSGTKSYIGIMDRCFGSSGRAAVSFFQFSFAFGGMCAFGIIIGDTIPHVIRSVFPNLPSTPVLSIFADRRFIIAFTTICVSYPLSLYRDIHKLSIASSFALCGMIIIVASVMFEGRLVSPLLRGDPSKRFSFIEPGIFQAIGVISFAFVCHHNSLLIYGSLRTPTLNRFATVTHVSTVVSLIACSVMAISGYVVFTDRTQGNILNNFSPNDTLINIARFCFGLNMFTTLPLELFVCREVIEQFFFSHEAFNMQRHIFFTTVILVSAMIVSLITCDLGVTLEITGGVSATALAYIFPAACFLKLTSARDLRTTLPAYVCVAFGALVMALSLALALGKAWTPAGEAKICM
ncbi:amino acid transporter [Russula ochroleuca]|uniref:Amino acid transporter n=1 Tax=Russula ochroleuca TaxID=152965 RepID=A0A9P5K0R8_9AGAM|nr:amino acid transporter [Russula ochroleuca]